MGNRSKLGEVKKTHGQPTKIKLVTQKPKGQIGKKVSVQHCINNRQAHSKSFVALKVLSTLPP